MLRDAPAPDHGDDRADGERRAPRAGRRGEAGRARAMPQTSERITSGSAVAREPVEDVPRVCVEGDEADGRERPGDDGGGERAVGEVPLEVGRAGAPGVADEEHAAR